MSGIFKYTPNRTASSTPNRRSALGTGFGSPGLPQDATMDNSYAMGFRSPSINALTGHGSPVQVRSLRENEEEISTLRKDNFNLKLRIYFLEQRAGMCPDAETPGLGVTTSSSTSGTSCDGNYLKQNIDLKVEVESLRRELHEKQELLCQAAKAIELLEESHRKTEEKHREMVADLNNRIESHLLEIKSLEKMGAELQRLNHELQHSVGRAATNDEEGAGFVRASARDAVGESLLDFLDTVQQHSEMSVQEKLKALEMDSVVRQCQERNEELSRQVEQLQAVIDEKTVTISQLEVQLGELRFENAEIREKLEELPSQADVEQSFCTTEPAISCPHSRETRNTRSQCCCRRRMLRREASMKYVELMEENCSECCPRGGRSSCESDQFVVPSPSSSTQAGTNPNEVPSIERRNDRQQHKCRSIPFSPDGNTNDMAEGERKERIFQNSFAPHMCRRIINEWARQYFTIDSSPSENVNEMVAAG
uniref:Centrosomin N-terminal motif 1 domain-containing protein n=1 Tax=Anopheles atroparvus TaxID=41427 RepID=A0AAG5CSV6_ANOAO